MQAAYTVSDFVPWKLTLKVGKILLSNHFFEQSRNMKMAILKFCLSDISPLAYFTKVYVLKNIIQGNLCAFVMFFTNLVKITWIYHIDFLSQILPKMVKNAYFGPKNDIISRIFYLKYSKSYYNTAILLFTNKKFTICWGCL